MRNTILIVTAYLALGARALPRPNAAPTYNVVDVGGPSSTETPDTIVETVTSTAAPQTVTETAPSIPEVVTQAPVTVTEFPSPTTTTGSWTVTIGGTSLASTSLTFSSVSSPGGVAETDSVFYNTIPPVPTYSAQGDPSPVVSSNSTSYRSAFPTTIGQWSKSSPAIASYPTATASFTYNKSPTLSSGFKKRWIAATGTGAEHIARAAPTGYWNSTAF